MTREDLGKKMLEGKIAMEEIIVGIIIGIIIEKIGVEAGVEIEAEVGVEVEDIIIIENVMIIKLEELNIKTLGLWLFHIYLI